MPGAGIRAETLVAHYPSVVAEIEERNPDQSGDLISELQSALVRTGAVSSSIDDLDVAPELWLASAREAAELLVRPVQTTTAGGSLFAVLTDWPVDDDELARDHAAIRATP